jgi:tetratricopeptide (TPR) repeat protein
MASLIPGFEYDVFISYRQKDNKYDSWVTEFVDNLKKELEATFKEEISVYFDINPSDYLLESYDVDASLKDKLKCLVFIPIISRTYCDSKSFAWEHEFMAFVEQASQDQFGLKVKLPNGNVASRVLPIRIYDLDNADIKLCESVLGGILRGVEFIYAEPGVNRPLKPDDDEKINLNKTKYRNQINKVGNAIKEIISGLLTEPVELVKEKTPQIEPLEKVQKEEKMGMQEKSVKAVKGKLLSTLGVLAVLIIAVIFAYPKIFKRDKLDNLNSSEEKISIAIMPFQNMTNDTIWNVWQDGIQDILINSLSNSEELKVRQSESIHNLVKNQGIVNYASITPSVASRISQKLDANIFIYGNIKQAGNKIRLYAQLIDSKTEEVFRSFQIEGLSKDEMIFNIIDSLSIMVKKYLIITKLGKDLPSYFKDYAYNTSSPEAFRYFILGRNEFMKQDFQTAINWLSQAISVDSNFIHAIVQLSLAYGNQNSFDEAKKWCLKAYEKRDQMSVRQRIKSGWVYAMYFETPHEAITSLNQLLDFDDQDPITCFNLGNSYTDLYQYDKAISEYEKALEIYDKWEVKPYWVLNYTSLGSAYHKNGMYQKEKKLYKDAEQQFPDDLNLIYNQAILSLTEGDSVSANEYIEKLLAIAKEKFYPEAFIATGMANMYTEAGILDKAEGYHRKALSLRPNNPDKFNNLACFLIEKDRNINNGLELIDKALELSPDNYDYLETKGWGLFKLGKYQEALEILQQSWDLRMKNAVYDHKSYLHLEAAKKAVASQKRTER